jgi:serine/threonine protein kinase/tetratricopeptide (TPR) repeat protein
MSSDNHVSAARGQSVSTGVLAAQDDPRVASALAAYLAELEAGRRPSREKWLEQHPEIAETLGDWFDIVEFVHSAAESGYSSRSPVPSEDSLPPETALGEYRLVREIARGGMAIVYEAEQVSLGRRVALKVLAGTAALDSLKLQRFRVETQAVAQLNHPHIVPIFAVGSERGSHFYAMQYIEGPTLAELIRQQRAAGSSPLAEPHGEPSPSRKRPKRPEQSPGSSDLMVNGFGEGAHDVSPSTVTPSGTSSVRGCRAFRAIAKLAIQAADALAHAHAMGILHRDIKPSNLLIDFRGNLWVTDFGLARFQDEPGVTRTGDLLGTLRYMAPELVLGHRIVHDPRSDIYSLGATLYELLTLKPVFDGRDRQELLRQIAQDEPVAPSKLDPAVPRDLETIVLKAMDKDPERRYPTAQQLADDLGRFLEDKPVLARRPTTADRVAKWARRHRAVLGATAAVAFLALGIAAPLLWWEQRTTAQVNDNLRLTFQQADRGFEQIIRLSDELTTKGMSRYAEAAQSPEANRIRTDFFRQAVEFYERLLHEPQIAKPMQALAFRRLGFARMVGMYDPRAAKDLQQSLELYKELLAGSPNDRELRRAISEVNLNVSMYCIINSRRSEAEAAFSRVKSMDASLLAEFPDDLAILEDLTEHWIQIAMWRQNSPTGSGGSAPDWDQLLEFYKTQAADASRSTALARYWASAYRQLAHKLEQVQRLSGAQEALRRALKFIPDDADLQSNLARLLVSRAESPSPGATEAIELAKRAVVAKPNDRAFMSTLALAYLRAGELPLAAETARKSMELRSSDGDASAQFLMAMISWRRGEKAAALDWYIQALDKSSPRAAPGPYVPTLRAEADRVLGRSKK